MPQKRKHKLGRSPSANSEPTTTTTTTTPSPSLVEAAASSNASTVNDTDSISPEDSVSQITGTNGRRSNKGKQRQYDQDDLSDPELSDDENNLCKPSQSYQFYINFNLL